MEKTVGGMSPGRPRTLDPLGRESRTWDRLEGTLERPKRTRVLETDLRDPLTRERPTKERGCQWVLDDIDPGGDIPPDRGDRRNSHRTRTGTTVTTWPEPEPSTRTGN